MRNAGNSGEPWGKVFSLLESNSEGKQACLSLWMLCLQVTLEPVQPPCYHEGLEPEDGILLPGYRVIELTSPEAAPPLDFMMWDSLTHSFMQ